MLNRLFKYAEIFKLAITRSKREGIQMPSNIDIINEIEKYVSDSSPYYYLHFSDDDHYKGVNVKTIYNTPMGVYAYPLTSNIIEQIYNNNLPFAGNRKYIHIFKATGNILYLDEYTKEDLDNDIEKLIKMYDNITIEALLKYGNKKSNTNAGILFSLVFYLANKFKHTDVDIQSAPKTNLIKQDALKARSLFKQLGYDGIHDSGFGIIYANEPEQAVIFDSKNIKHINIIKNPLNTYKVNFSPLNKMIQRYLPQAQEIAKLIKLGPSKLEEIEEKYSKFRKHIILEPEFSFDYKLYKCSKPIIFEILKLQQKYNNLKFDKEKTNLSYYINSLQYIFDFDFFNLK